MTVYEIVRTKIKDISITELDIQLAITELAQVIKNYCNIEKIPEALKYTWANMAVDLAKYNYEINNDSDGNLAGVDAGDISSLKIGDTQISLEGGNSERAKLLRSHRPNLDQIIMNYQHQLNKFRRVVW